MEESVLALSVRNRKLSYFEINHILSDNLPKCHCFS